MNEKKLNLNQSVYDLCREHPEVPSIMESLGFTEIVKPGMLGTMGRFMTIPKGAAMKGIPLDVIKKAFEENGFTIE